MAEPAFAPFHRLHSPQRNAPHKARAEQSLLLPAMVAALQLPAQRAGVRQVTMARQARACGVLSE